MTDNKGTKVLAPIVTPTSEDSFPTHISNMGKGGYHTVYSLADRDSIPMARREEGMLCAVVEEGTISHLIGGLENTFWKPLKIGETLTKVARELSYSPTGELVSADVQSALDELETKKVSSKNVYTREETDTILGSLEIDYNDLLNPPDLDSLHEHANINALNRFVEIDGKLTWNGKAIGDMITETYDADKDGVIDSVRTLGGLLISPLLSTQVAGLTGNIQQQLNTLSNAISNKADTTAVPTKTSQLINDSNFAITKTRNIITAYPTTDFKLTVSNDYQTLPLQGNVSVGNAFSIIGGNGIRCSKAGVIKVSLKTTYHIIQTENIKWGTAWLDTVAISANSNNASDRITCVGSDTLVNVTAGQILYLKAQGYVEDVIRGGKEYTHITVEYID